MTSANEVDFMTSANKLVADVVPKLMQNLFEELWRVRYKDQEEDIRNWQNEEKCGQILAHGIGGATTSPPTHYAIKDESIRRLALSEAQSGSSVRVGTVSSMLEQHNMKEGDTESVRLGDARHSEKRS